MYTRQKIAAIGKAITIPIAARMEGLPSIPGLSVLPEDMDARLGWRAAVHNARPMDGAFQLRKGWHGSEPVSVSCRGGFLTGNDSCPRQGFRARSHAGRVIHGRRWPRAIGCAIRGSAH